MEFPSAPSLPLVEYEKGDPLSPFLFIIIVEGLSRFIKASITEKTLAGLPIHGIYPPVSHNQFFDDTLMLGSSTVREALRILCILQTFYEASGMDINREKSQIFFFNTSIPVQLHITNILGFTHSSLPSKYPGIPVINKALQNSSWEGLLSSLVKRLFSWNFCSLNLPSCLILLKSILQALPIYSFSALVAPRFILIAIKNLQRNFLWKGAKNDQKIALISWEKICKPKLKEVLGSWDPTILNKVLSAKIWWRWIKHPKDLWA